MNIDPESKSYLRKELNRLLSEQVRGLVIGKFPDIASVERQRGIIVGLGLAIDIIEEKPATPTGTLPEGSQDESTD